MWYLHKFAVIIVLVFLAPLARAVTLDWDAVTWTSGQANSYDVDPASAGNDITVAVSTANLGAGTLTDVRDTSMQGGLATAENTLNLTLDLTTQSQYVIVTVTFSGAYTGGVNNVSFKLFDIDFSNVNGAKFEDQIRSVTGIGADGVTQVAATITGSPNNTVTGTGLNQVITGVTTASNTGAGSGDANATISFGSTPIKSFTFIYGSGSGTAANPTTQKVAIYDITFTPVPEANPLFGVAFSCVAATLLVLRHNARFRK